jgi:hypothetical protein
MLGKLKFIFIDVLGFYSDFVFYLTGSLDNISKPNLV